VSNLAECTSTLLYGFMEGRLPERENPFDRLKSVKEKREGVNKSLQTTYKRRPSRP